MQPLLLSFINNISRENFDFIVGFNLMSSFIISFSSQKFPIVFCVIFVFSVPNPSRYASHHHHSEASSFSPCLFIENFSVSIWVEQRDSLEGFHNITLFYLTIDLRYFLFVESQCCLSLYNAILRFLIDRDLQFLLVPSFETVLGFDESARKSNVNRHSRFCSERCQQVRAFNFLFHSFRYLLFTRIMRVI